MSQTKFDSITRTALWASYDNNCFYCSQPLDWNDVHIDHIIPEKYLENNVEFEALKIDYELDVDYGVNYLYNLVPSHAKCNLRKGGGLFNKQTTLFYLSITKARIKRIEKEIDKLKARKNKGQIISKLQVALATDLINVKELEKIYRHAQETNWKTTEIKLPLGLEFIDEVYDSFYMGKDLSVLFDKKLLVGGSYDYIELSNDKDEILKISTLREWKDALDNNYYPANNFNIKMSSGFTFLNEFIESMTKAKMPKVSFVSEPWIEIDDIDYLSPKLLFDSEGGLKQYIEQGLSIGDLVRNGVVKINPSGIYKISVEFGGMETSMIEQFRADFNDDGIEDIFVRGWTQAVGGTLGYGFTSVLTRMSNRSLIEEIS